MNVDGVPYRTIWLDPGDRTAVRIIDQRKLPYRFEIATLRTVGDFAAAIRDMAVRGAGLLGAAGGYGMYVAALHARDDRFDADMPKAAAELTATRPTARDLGAAVRRQLEAISQGSDPSEKRRIALRVAEQIAEENAEAGRKMGEHGAALMGNMSRRKGGAPVEVLTHCNAGWLGMVDHGAALAPVYAAFDRGVALHVWVDETRPRNQGAALTAWELARHGVPHRIIVDNAAGHLMQHGMVDIVIVGADRVTRAGDVANKIGTYQVALAAADNGVPFYAAVPASTFDREIHPEEIPIEERDPEEVRRASGLAVEETDASPAAGARAEDNPEILSVLLCPQGSTARNYAFDVTPARLITGLITETGILSSPTAGRASERSSSHPG